MSTETKTSQEKVKTSFLHFIHSFRGVAILFVVGGHILLVWQPNMISEKLLNSIFRNGTVLFVFIAGYLFQHLSSKYETLDYWKKKIQYVIIPYILISIPAIILRFIETPKIVLSENPNYDHWSTIQKIGYYYISGAHLQPLWFVPMISLFYISAPILIKMDRNKWLYRLLPLFIVISILVPRQALSDIPRMYVHFFSVYVLGMFFSRYKHEIFSISERWWAYFSGITLVFCILTFLDSVYYDTLMYLQKISFCWFFIYWLNRFDRYVPKFFDPLAELSFGIFFLHYYFLLLFKFISEKYLPYFIVGNVLNWTIHFLLITLSTSLILVIVKKIFPKHSRYLVGS